jgi:hypothetical protein
LALGFPPIACDFGCKLHQDRSLKKYRAIFEYAGHIDDIEEITKWLWENVPILTVPVEYKFPVTYQYNVKPNLIVPDFSIIINSPRVTN